MGYFGIHIQYLSISLFLPSRLAVLIKYVSRFSSLFMRTIIDNVRITNKKLLTLGRS